MFNRRALPTSSQAPSTEEKRLDIPIVDNTERRAQLISRIESIALSLIEQISESQPPKLSFSIHRNDPSLGPSKDEEEEIVESSENLEEDSRDFEESVSESRKTEEGRRTSGRVIDFASRDGKDKLALVTTTLATAHRLLVHRKTMTRRSFYYHLKNETTGHLVPSQTVVDRSVNHVADLLDCSPWELNFVATSKGLAAGELSLTLTNNQTIDFTVPGGALIPQIASNVVSVRTRAKLVLIVEKDAVFQKLLEEDCVTRLDCILVTGKGYPDVATRMLVKLLSEKMDLPVYIIVDADPFGVDIMCVYRFGSEKLSREKESLACDSIRWLGIFPSELQVLGVPTIPLTRSDMSRLMAIEGRSYASEALLKELRIMHSGKAEIEGVSSSFRNFLTSTYLPCKIKGRDYI